MTYTDEKFTTGDSVQLALLRTCYTPHSLSGLRALRHG